MKRTIFFVLMLLVVQVSQAQFSFGLRGGLNFANLPEKTYSLDDAKTTTISTLSDSYTGFHVGAMAQISLLGLFIMPELLFVSTGNDLVLNRQGEDPAYFKQKFSQLDIPVMVGTKLGPVRLGLGPVASILLNSKSNLPEGAEFKERFNSATYGMQLGAGLTLGNLAIDLKYQFGLSNLGDGIEIGNRTYNFDTRPRQFILSIGFLLF
jgi:hypothetical protein